MTVTVSEYMQKLIGELSANKGKTPLFSIHEVTLSTDGNGNVDDATVTLRPVIGNYETRKALSDMQIQTMRDFARRLLL